MFMNRNKEYKSGVLNGHIAIPASCGELVQGYLGGKPFLINSPIDMFAFGRISFDLGSVKSGRVQSIFPKAYKAAMEFLGDGAGYLELKSSIPRGKGMASSTAEIAVAISSCLARNDASSVQIMHEKVLGIDGSTDATYLPGITMINQLSGDVYRSMAAPPPMGIVVVDQGGELNTEAYDRDRAQHHATGHQGDYFRAVSLVRQGLAAGNSKLIAAGASISTKIQQSFLPNDLYPFLENLVDGNEVLGINTAHTGTVLGVLFDERRHDAKKIKDKVVARVGCDRVLGIHRLISGGVFRA
tara:strand:+ start:360 stop:1256 length:897 start_codon:yes stop_codon:yes gene_type:complete